jgi:TonB family protein
MDDRIGDLLAERTRLGGNAAGGIAVSVLLHGLLAAGIVYGAMHAAAPMQVSTLNIRFAGVGSGASEVVEKPVPPPQAPPVAKKVTIPEPVAEPAKPVAKSDPKTVPFSNFGRSTKKGSETPQAPTPHSPLPTPQTKPGVVGGIDIPIGSTGVTGIEGDFPYTIYVDRMKTLIGQRWLRPQGATGTTTVSFVIDRDGTIRDAKSEIPSGNGTFDRAALRAVLEASPLPPLPFGYNGTFLGVHLTFR